MLQLYTFIYVWFTERKLTTSASASILALNSFMHNQDEVLGAKLLLWSVHGMHILNRLTGLMMKAAELEIKTNFHAGMPLVYNII